MSQATLSSGSDPSGASGVGYVSSATLESGSGLAGVTGKSELPPEQAFGDVYCIVLHALGTGDPVVSQLQSLASFAYFAQSRFLTE